MDTENKRVQFVIKTSKLCNLRCRYCYEYPELGNKTSISLEQLEQIYKNISSYYNQLDEPTEIQFVWHGGEPLLQSPDFYWQAFDSQQEIFGELASSVTNVVQTNLTVLNKERIRLLAEGFDGVGVSVDLFGGLRVNQAGVDSLSRVLKNMDYLQAENIKFGCITVLTKLNLPYIKEIFRFYEKMQLSFRLLPLFKGAFDNQHQGFEITPEEVVTAFNTLVDLWMESQELVMIMPLIEHIEKVIRHHNPESKPYFYDKAEWESIYVVNVNGDLYSYADAYNIEMSHGNLVTTPLENIVRGKQHQKAIAAAEERMAASCYSCQYFGSCNGYPMAEEAILNNQFDESGNLSCIIDQRILQHIEMRFNQAGFIDPTTGIININRPQDAKILAALECPV
jgi:uncharacterized protein